MDIHEITTEVNDHTSIKITREYDAQTHQTTAIRTAPHLTYYTSPPYATTTTQSNVTSCSSQKKGGEGGELAIAGISIRNSALSDRQQGKQVRKAKPHARMERLEWPSTTISVHNDVKLLCNGFSRPKWRKNTVSSLEWRKTTVQRLPESARTLKYTHNGSSTL